MTQSIMAGSFPQWIVRTALTTSETLCATFSWQDQDDDDQNGRRTCRKNKSRRILPDGDPYQDDDDQDAFDDYPEDTLGDDDPIPLCLNHVWKDFDSSLDNLASDILSFATSTPPIPREITISNEAESPVGHGRRAMEQEQQHHRHLPSTSLIPPRPLSRTAPRLVRHSPVSPAGSPCHSCNNDLIASGTSVVSSLGSESLVANSNNEEEEEEEDSLLEDLEDEIEFMASLPGPLRRQPWSSSETGTVQSPLRMSRETAPVDRPSSPLVQSPAVNRTFVFSPPDISRHAVSLSQRSGSAFPRTSATMNHGTTDDSGLSAADENTCSLLVMEREDVTTTSSALESGRSQEPLSSEGVISERDQPEEGASTTCFTYSTQETSDSFFLPSHLDSSPPTELVRQQQQQEEVETTTNRSCPPNDCADGSSYSTSYNNHDYYILQAATTVKRMLVVTNPNQTLESPLLSHHTTKNKKLRERSPTTRKTTTTTKGLHRSHWFLPSPQETCMSGMSTPSHSPTCSPCGSVAEISV